MEDRESLRQSLFAEIIDATEEYAPTPPYPEGCKNGIQSLEKWGIDDCLMYLRREIVKWVINSEMCKEYHRRDPEHRAICPASNARVGMVEEVIKRRFIK